MSIHFTVSAPGKVILNGEHSVVYGKPGLAGVIGLRNFVTFTENHSDKIRISLDKFPDKDIEFSVQELNSCLRLINPQTGTREIDLRHESILYHADQFAQSHFCSPNESLDIKKTGTAIIYLFAIIETSLKQNSEDEIELKNGFNLVFKSNIVSGAGLGSSAVFAVCTAAVFYIFSLIRENRSLQTEIIKSLNECGDKQTDFRKKVSNWAFLSERIMHGSPSGLDNTICTYGNVVKFERFKDEFNNITLKHKINILLVNSGISRNTSLMVKKVAELHHDYREVLKSIMDSLGALVNNVVEILESDKSEIEQYEHLKALYIINHNLLRAIGVSHPVLENIYAISERNGFGCKLTGAGGGGYAIILLPSTYAEDENYQQLCSELTEAKLDWNVTSIGGKGLEISQE